MATQSDPVEITRLQKKFKVGLSRWFAENDFSEGLPVDDIKIKGQIEFANKLGGVVSGLFDSVKPRFSGGATAAEACELIRPLTKLSDTLAIKVEYNVQVFLVIYADKLSPSQLRNQLEQITLKSRPLGKIGLKRFGFQSMGTQVFPLLIFFNRQRFDQIMPKLHEEGVKMDIFHWQGVLMGHRVNLETAFIDVSSGKVIWAEGGAILSRTRAPLRKLEESFGISFQVFTAKDLQAIMG